MILLGILLYLVVGFVVTLLIVMASDLRFGVEPEEFVVCVLIWPGLLVLCLIGLMGVRIVDLHNYIKKWRKL